MDDLKWLGARIKSIRNGLGLTLKEFGGRIGMSAAAISNIENGVYAPKASTISLICITFGINRDWLENGSGDIYAVAVPDKPENDRPLTQDEAFARNTIAALAKMPPEFWKMARALVEEIWQQYHPGDTPTDPDR